MIRVIAHDDELKEPTSEENALYEATKRASDILLETTQTLVQAIEVGEEWQPLFPVCSFWERGVHAEISLGKMLKKAENYRGSSGGTGVKYGENLMFINLFGREDRIDGLPVPYIKIYDPEFFDLAMNLAEFYEWNLQEEVMVRKMY